VKYGISNSRANVLPAGTYRGKNVLMLSDTKAFKKISNRVYFGCSIFSSAQDVMNYLSKKDYRGEFESISFGFMGEATTGISYGGNPTTQAVKVESYQDRSAIIRIGSKRFFLSGAYHILLDSNYNVYAQE